MVKSESPDFIFILDEKKIRIEVTDIYQDSKKGASILKQQSSYKERFTEILMSELRKCLSYNFGIDVDFDLSVQVKKSDYLSISRGIFDICYPHLKDMTGNYASMEFEGWLEKLPDSIKSIRITRIEGLDEPHNFQSEGGAIPVLTNSEILSVIKKKESVFKKYQKCDEYWLLIREGNYHSGSFGRHPELELPLTTLFLRVYLIRTNYRELISLTYTSTNLGFPCKMP